MLWNLATHALNILCKYIFSVLLFHANEIKVMLTSVQIVTKQKFTWTGRRVEFQGVTKRKNLESYFELRLFLSYATSDLPDAGFHGMSMRCILPRGGGGLGTSSRMTKLLSAPLLTISRMRKTLIQKNKIKPSPQSCSIFILQVLSLPTTRYFSHHMSLKSV